MNLLDELQANGVDVERTLERFLGNETLYLRFLRKFPQDQSFQNTMDALQQYDFQVALHNAHTLKGLAANLGLDSLSFLCNELVTRIRHNDYGDYTPLCNRLQTTYQNYITLIEKADES